MRKIHASSLTIPQHCFQVSPQNCSYAKICFSVFFRDESKDICKYYKGKVDSNPTEEYWCSHPNSARFIRDKE